MGHDRTVFLCGFSGAGKSETGKILAHRLGVGFIDIDDVVAEKLGMPIPEIFDSVGEARFREVEKEIIRAVACEPPIIVAVGGGAVADQENLDRIKRCGLLVYLKVTPETSWRRLHSSHRRPKLEPPAEDRSSEARKRVIETLMGAREPFYRQADYTVDTEGKTPDEVATEIARVVCSDERRTVDNRRH
jgi:shikimate kinase